MPTSIPYDPRFVLGNIIETEHMTTLQSIAEAQGSMDNAQAKLNALILQKRSFDMTLLEMTNLGVLTKDLEPLTKQIETLTASMVLAAVEYGIKVIDAEKKIAAIKDAAPQTRINEQVESPIDYNRSAIKKMPLSSDSLTMDAQYFSKESKVDESYDQSTSIAAYVSASVSRALGPKVAVKAAAAVKGVMDSQHEHHAIEGTLVITANCTHKQVDVFAPFVLDVDKAIRAWNLFNADEKIDIVLTPAGLEKIDGYAQPKDSTVVQKAMNLLSGATYGSSFVGMVHILQQENTESTQSASAVSASLRAQMEVGSWFASESGKFGVDSSFADSVKSLLSTSNLQSHASVITMGLIPSIKSNTVTTMVKQLMGDPQKHMEQLGAIQGGANSVLTTVASSASAAKDGQSLSTLSTDYMKAAVDAVGEMDKRQNQVLDTNSVMTAFDDYIQKAIAGECGVPINFFVKPITKDQLAKAWINKYFPERLIGANSGDDTANAEKDKDTKGDDTKK